MDISTLSETHVEQLKAITNLRSCKEIDKTIHSKPVQVEAQKPSTSSSNNLEPLSSEQDCVSRKEEEKKVPCPIPAPFPQRL